jgi:hypothetical protein
MGLPNEGDIIVTNSLPDPASWETPPSEYHHPIYSLFGIVIKWAIYEEVAEYCGNEATLAFCGMTEPFVRILVGQWNTGERWYIK